MYPFGTCPYAIGGAFGGGYLIGGAETVADPGPGAMPGTMYAIGAETPGG